MKRAISNAFTRSSNGFRSPYRSLAASLASMRVRVETTVEGFAVELTPMSTFDAVGAWTLIGDPDLEHRPLNIVLDVTVEPDPVLGAETAAGVAARWGIGVVPVGDGALLASDTALRQLMTLTNVTSITIIRVVSPIETETAEALARSIRSGGAPLDDPRVIAAMTVRGDQYVVLEARLIEQALRLPSENLRHYLAAICNEPAASFAPVPIAVLAPWLHDGGGLTIRPIETETYSTFVDVGVCPTAETDGGPATCSLIYDLPSGSWHGEG